MSVIENNMKSKEKIKVLVLESRFDLGGAERITYDITTKMNQSEFDITFCSLYGPGDIGDTLIKEGHKFYRNIIRTKYDIGAFFKLRRILKNNKIQIIYLINQPLTLFWGVILGKTCKIPVVTVIHNTFVANEELKLRIYKLLIPLVERVVAVAGIQKEYLIKFEGIPENLIKVIYNGIEFSKFCIPVNREEKIRSFGLEKFKIVGIVGRLSYVKGIDLFLYAAKYILQENENTQFAIVGEGPERAKLEALAKDLNIHKRVHFLGSRTDVNEILPIFDVAVLCSRTEAFPMAILEYMASEKAIVATSVGSIPELIKDGETGCLVQKENPVALAEKILYLLKNRKLASLMGVRAKLLVKEKFSVEFTVRETEALIRELVAKFAKRQTSFLS
jgi:glycosyltransferase involved in cell wall biosynthesis